MRIIPGSSALVFKDLITKTETLIPISELDSEVRNRLSPAQDAWEKYLAEPRAEEAPSGSPAMASFGKKALLTI